MHRKILFLLVFFLPIILFGQGSLRTTASLGEGINFSNRGKTLNTTLYSWAHFSGYATNSFTNSLDLNQNSYHFTLNRMRFGARGFILEENFRYHFQFSVAPSETRVPPNSEVIFFNGLLDGFLEYEFFEGFSISVGQRFLPGTRNSFTEARNLQFIDRSQLFLFSGYDRDIGVFGSYALPIGNTVIKPTLAITQGEGRNITPNLGGLNYQARLDFYPFGSFTNDNEVVEGDQFRERTAKLVLGAGIGYNDNARREGGFSSNIVEVERDIISLYADLLFKYNGFAFMAEFFEKFSDIPVVYDTSFSKIAVFTNGFGYNFQTSYLMESNWEIAARYSSVFPTEVIQQPNREKYSLALNKYIDGHGIKFQTEVYYLNSRISNAQTNGIGITFLLAAGF